MVRDAKFGIWAHWGGQCEPEHGDWCARGMYEQGSAQYESHLGEYGHPSTNGFKDVIRQWKAADFDPDKLLAFYKENGARHFMALAVHCDNFDNWNSRYQPWNSVRLGPCRDPSGVGQQLHERTASVSWNSEWQRGHVFNPKPSTL